MSLWGEDSSITPPGGWYYIQPGTRFRFEANTLGQLEDKVSAHRRGNNITLGHPREDILAWTRSRLGGEEVL